MTIYSQYGSLDNRTILLGKSYTSTPHVKLQNWEKAFENQYNSGSALSPKLTCGPAPLIHNICVLVRSVCKGEVRTPVKVKERKFYFKKLTCGRF